MVLAPELVGLLATFLLVCALMALSFSYQYSVGALIRAIARLFQGIAIPVPFHTLHPFAFLGNALDAVDHAIQHGFGVGIEYAQYGFNKVLQAVAYTIQEIVNGIEGLAHDTLYTLTHWRRVLIPNLIAATFGPLAAIVYALRDQVARLAVAGAHAITHAVTTIIHETPIITHKVERITKKVYVSVAAATAGAVAIPWGAIRGLERDVSGLEKWVKAHRRILTEASAAGLVAAALGKLGLGWMRCSRVGRVGKAVCGMDEGLLESLLTGALVVASSISVVELARECQGFAGDVDDALRFFVRELR